jgi:hypothetical protein
MRGTATSFGFVIPARAGIQSLPLPSIQLASRKSWIPAYAGMTSKT